MATDFGIKLKELREKRGWTQSQLADALKKTLRQVQRYEGKVIPKPQTIQLLSKEFDYDFFQLLRDKESRLKLNHTPKTSDSSHPNQDEYVQALKKINSLQEKINGLLEKERNDVYASLDDIKGNQAFLAARLKNILQHILKARSKAEKLQYNQLVLEASKAESAILDDILKEGIGR